ncbi:hypothetical protein SAMN05216571_101236 [Onishia taeanensis]|uniref:Helix-turn-helix domain-containing protein n=1 Tax=Onishia taeanensis TaxID=284577 RepID=A0A1G7N559_9GAMM|nr:hypothetical protein [Halomonas taeanensis]SDF69188.1 hypothetical protein SAMN05216571_101236 [Halomonas taeanensis]
MMKLRDYLKSLSDSQIEGYADRVGTSSKYLRSHVMGASRGASLKFMRALANESGGKVQLLEVLEHYGVPPEELGKGQAA